MTRNVSNYYLQKIVLISGAASGIGKALAQTLAQYGSTVVLADRDFAAAKALSDQLTEQNLSACAYPLDVRDRDAFRQLAQDVVARFGRIDMLFNNAGVAIGGPAYEYSQQDWDDVVDVNLKGVIHGVDAVYPLMRAQGFGQIVNTASVLALCPSALTIAYSASKAAVNALSLTLRVEAEHFGIKVNTLCPGPVDTPILFGGKFGRSGHGVTHNAMQRFWQKQKPMAADAFAQQALVHVANNAVTIILPRRWRVAAWLSRISPAFWLSYSRKIMAKFVRARARTQTVKPAL